jgi:rhamnopyranosyl-N-acetylglucosaminyl-diphospho-decaprenol beta-1,3/1,4-galactofuranosyltransferase
MSRSAKVVAVVVTWNRKELLARNLRAVMAQTRPVDEILVVDNASTDSTPEMLAAAFPQVRVIRLAGNAGAAGGMHVAVREGLKRDADWLWLMDDDGVPSPGCLAEQLRVAERENYALCGPLLLDIDDRSRLAFSPSSADMPQVVAALRMRLGKDHFDSRIAGLWNGTLVRAAAVRDCGAPKAEMFIWGEEHEYAHRFAKMGYRVGVAAMADYLHPKDRFPSRWVVDLKVGNTVIKKCRFCDPGSPRSTIYARNLGYNDFRYGGLGRALARLMLGIVLFGRDGGLGRALTFARYYLDGLTDRYALEPSREKIRARLATQGGG